MPARATTQQRHRAELNQDEQDVLDDFNSQTFLYNYAKNVMDSSPGTQTKLLQKAEAHDLALTSIKKDKGKRMRLFAESTNVQPALTKAQEKLQAKTPTTTEGIITYKLVPSFTLPWYSMF